MNKCECHHTQNYYHNGYLCRVKQECWGTRERDECSCDGDRTKCDFYPEIREKVLKEIESKFGEWISVEDRLPSNSVDVLSYSNLGLAICHYSAKHKLFNAYDENDINDAKMYCLNTTHWMPLPRPPKGE